MSVWPSIVPSILLTAALPFVGYGLIHALTGWLERRRRTRPGPRATPDGEIGARVVGLALLVVLTLLLGATLPGELHLAATLLGLVAMATAWALHGAPGHSRGFKYGLFLGGGALFGTTFGTDRTLPEWLGLEWTMLIIAPSVLVVVGSTIWIVFVLRPDVPSRSPVERSLVHRWYWRVTSIQGPDPGSFVRYLPLMIGQLGPGFLLIRYAVKAKLLEEPFLYLRPSRPEDGPRVFTDVVGPGLARRGPFVGLVPGPQRATELGRLTEQVPHVWSAGFTSVRDEDWQIWVVSTVSRAKAVVLDVTGADGTRLPWAIEECLALVPPERLLVLSQTLEPSLDSGYTHVLVDLDRPDAARTAVAGFAAHVTSRTTALARETVETTQI
ncbi:MAG: hypothetical protein AAF211_09610, partial [Myxococcota bacterium]